MSRINWWIKNNFLPFFSEW